MRSIARDQYGTIEVSTPNGKECFSKYKVNSVSMLNEYEFGNGLALPVVMYRIDGTTTVLPCNSVDEAHGVYDALRISVYGDPIGDFRHYFAPINLDSVSAPNIAPAAGN